MIKPVAIDKNTGRHPSLDFEFLRSAGVAWIQQLAGKSWTDFNLHDPGVTILEALCFAITELAYRTDFPIQDLLSDEKGHIDYKSNAFFLKEDILTCNPVTINDYRKVIIDEIEEVQNVWLYPVKSAYSEGALSGLYKIYVQVKSEIAEKLLADGAMDDDIAMRVRHCFVSRRNLCEDIIEEIVILRPAKISIEAEILVDGHHITEEILANIYYYLENSLNAPVRYYSENELLDRGLTVDEIYSGPFLKKGFIPDSELKDRKVMVDPTELIRSVSQIEGVLSVKKLKIVQGQRSRNNKPLVISENSFPLFDIPASERHIKLYKDNFELPIKRPAFRLILQKIKESHNRSFITSFYNKSSKNIIKGKYRNNERYYTIQNQFPKVYGIGNEGLLAGVSKQRRAQAKQLKAYLLFFEQIMVNYLGQLSHVADIFSIDINKDTHQNTYYKKPLYDVPDVRYLLREFTSWSKNLSDSDWEAFKRNINNGYIHGLSKASETDRVYTERKSMFFEHILARFNEFFSPYPAKLYSSLYEPRFEDDRINPELKWKSRILKNIPGLGSGRVRACNYLEPDEDRPIIDFAARMRMLLSIRDWNGEIMLSSVLDDDRISVESDEKKVKESESHRSGDTPDMSWQNEMPEILINKDEIGDLFDRGKVITGDDIPNDAFLLKRQKADVLRHAIDIQNFRIGPNPAREAGFVLLYKAPADERWVTISRFPRHEMAMSALKRLIGYLREVNIKSEGFYLLEHILLRPDYEARNFGFRFIAGDGQRLMEHSKWMSFEEREKVIASLLDVLGNEHELTPEKLAPLCKINLYAPASEVPESAGQRNKAESGNLFNYFKLYAAQRDKFLSRFEMVTRGEDNSMISEDFFNWRMSVVFPSWPARFQDQNFREAAENLFRLNVPAHVNISFLWMNVTRLKKFEALYFDWKRFISNDTDKETRNDLRNALVQILNKY